MEEQAKTPVLIDDDWPAVEPGYGMQCLSEPRALAEGAPAATRAPTPQRDTQEWSEARPRAPRRFPSCGALDHFPAMFARSALFSGQRQARAVEPPPIQGKIKGQMHHNEMEFAGPRLSMSDKAVYEAVVRLAKVAKIDLGEPLRTSLREIAATLKMTWMGGTALDWIWHSLERLAASELTFRLGDKSAHRGKLLLAVRKDEGGVDVLFDAEFAFPAFGGDTQYLIDTDRRARLGLPLAQWLHDFLSTHKVGEPMDLKYLRSLSGVDLTPKSFCRALRKAAARLCEIAPEVAQTFAIDDYRESSERWTITFTRGAEGCKFFPPTEWNEAKRDGGKSARERGAQL